MTHTPGIWTYTFKGGRYVIQVDRNTGNTFDLAALFAEGRQYDSKNSWEANAKLIAAAPELLEACQKAYDLMGDQKTVIGTHIRAVLIAAIKKATE